MPRLVTDVKGQQFVHILWTRCGYSSTASHYTFNPNHFVPIFLIGEDSHSKTCKAHVSVSAPKLVQTKLNLPPKKLSKESIASLERFFSEGAKRKQEFDCISDDSATPEKKPCFPLFSGSVSSFDIGHFVFSGKQLDDSELADFLKNIWIPPQDFEFPLKLEPGKSRKFLLSWLNDFPWLAYSKFSNGCFCVPCVFFAKKIGHSEARIKVLLKEPLCYWTSAREKLKQHSSKSLTHKDSVLMMEGFKRRMENSGENEVHVLADSALKKRIEYNRSILASVIDCIVFCGQQCFGLRAHRDDAKYLEIPGHNPGNFQALLNFRIRSGDKVLEEHFKNCPKNATYRSKGIQNELISCIDAYILGQLILEIKAAKFFSILADEVSDVGGQEQMPLVLRFVDASGQIREVFLKFVFLTNTTGKAIADNIKKEINKMGLDISYCRGQSYDGAGNMSGKCIGAAKLILDDNSKALFVHCASHRLNLCVARSCDIPTIKKLFGVISKTRAFFSYPKRLICCRVSSKIHFPMKKDQSWSMFVQPGGRSF